MSKNNLPQPHRLLFLDGLRGFAAVYIIFFHVVNVPQPNLRLPAFIFPILMNGVTGVSLFFLISAFTLCYTLSGMQQNTPSTVTFYIRRICRIIPLYYLWLIITMAIYWGLGVSMLKNPDFYLYAGFGYNFTAGKQWGIVPASWTLSIEVIFYLSFPLLFKWISTLKKAVLFLFLTLLISYVHYVIVLRLNIAEYKPEMNILSHLPTFATGILTFYIYKTISEKKTSAKRFTVFFIGAGLFLLLPYVFAYTPTDYFTRMYVMTFTYAVLFLGLAIRPVLFFTNRTAVFFGTISYSLYLNHPQIIWRAFAVYEHVYNWHQPLLVRWLTCTALTIVPLIAVSYITYRFIEKPGMALGKHLIKKLAYWRDHKREVLEPVKQF